MAALPKLEVASGVIDGVNTVFTVSGAYAPLSVSVFLNGQLKRKDFVDGWSETNPAAGVVTLAEAPRAGDVVQIYFLDGSGLGPPDVVEVSPLVGKIVFVADLSGKLVAEQEVRGETTSAGELSGTLRDDARISASIEETGQLQGILTEVCP